MFATGVPTHSWNCYVGSCDTMCHMWYRHTVRAATWGYMAHKYNSAVAFSSSTDVPPPPTNVTWPQLCCIRVPLGGTHMKGRHGRWYIHCRYIYEHYIKNSEPLSISLSACTSGEGGGTVSLLTQASGHQDNLYTCYSAFKKLGRRPFFPAKFVHGKIIP